MAAEAALRAARLTVIAGDAKIVDAASFALSPGEIVGLVGPSGSGKSVLALALLGLVRPGLRIADGAVTVGGVDLLAASPAAQRALRGKQIALIMQNARAALDPLARIGAQIVRVMAAHDVGDAADRRERAIALLAGVGINDPERRLDAYPHELSGGMAQRAVIAIALASDPLVLIADEPATGLDVTVRAQFLDALWRSARARGVSVLLASQEPGVLANYCDRIISIEAGRITQDEPVRSYFARRAPHAQATAPAQRAPATADAPLIAARGVSKAFGSARARVPAVADADLDLFPGDSVGLIGESGSGKSTLGRILVGLLAPDAGDVRIDGVTLTKSNDATRRRLRGRVQLVQQDPLDSFDPRWTLGDSIVEPIAAHERMTRSQRRARALALLDRVGLPHALCDAYPRDAPPGQLQRAAVARALSTSPRFIVLDEVTALLTPDVRRALVASLARVRDEDGATLLFISHDLESVRGLCARVAVMYLGRIVESGPAAAIFADPRHPYTQALLAAELGEDVDNRRIDRPQPHDLAGDGPVRQAAAPGCALAPRCSYVEARCRTDAPPLRDLGAGRSSRCWRAEALHTLRTS
ncbi:MAG: ABC transporter ATP-binding protein [Hyphomonadaceae bacterium]|nr:ABC transporter ATP-binding protein [Hyphomonadaceae bacterium]